MEVSSARYCTLCLPPSEKETAYSLIARVTVIFLACTALIAGILAVQGKIPAIGTTGGWVGIAGALTIGTVACFLRFVKKLDEDESRIFDPRVESLPSSVCEKRDDTGKTVTEKIQIVPLHSFLTSSHPEDIAVLKKLKERLQVESLAGILTENYGAEEVSLALPIVKIDGKIIDSDLLELLFLIYAKPEEIMALAIEDIQKYDDEKRNILCLRLNKLPAATLSNASYPYGSFGWFLQLKGKALKHEIISRNSIPTALFIYLSREQIMEIGEDAITEDPAVLTMNYYICEQMFGRQHLCFIKQRANAVFSLLPSKFQNAFLPYLHSKFLYAQMVKGVSLDYKLLSKKQISALFSTDAKDEEKSRKKMEALPVEILNQILPGMNAAQLRLIPDKHLKEAHLKINAIDDVLLKELFPLTPSQKEESIKRMQKLHKNNIAYLKYVLQI